ncbi:MULTISPECIES: DUF6646 family protein [Flavobacterium]|uniref:OmpA family outer membrane protein n=1 Tax=Flavobacterium hankyongi TaxID=1176532 RepID=A0ABP8ZNE0_9FLAO|nr:DUF6646 family protein [Flavobacterium sp. N1846]
MKKILFIVSLLVSAFFVNAQAYKGKGDTKFQVGANIQDGGTGITSTVDFGIGENMSFGFQATYMLSANKILDEKPKFGDRADIRARFNANLGNVINVDEKFDVYPGLDLGLRNFGAHLGARYFFTDGFGVYTEFALPIAKYDSTPGLYGHYNNQFNASVGMSFNL